MPLAAWCSVSRYLTHKGVFSALAALQILAIPPGIAVVRLARPKIHPFIRVIQRKTLHWPGRCVKADDSSQKTGLSQAFGSAATIHAQGTAMNTSAVAQSHAQRARLHARSARRHLPRHLFTPRRARAVLPTPVPDEVFSRILTAAHHAPSVGFMQPWNFLVVRSPDTKRRVQGAFAKAHAEAAWLTCSRATNVPPTKSSSSKASLNRPSASASPATASAPAPWWWGAPT